MKAIRYNNPRHSDKEEFDATSGYTLHANGITLYFDRIKETHAGYVFMKYDAEVGFVAKDECEVSPVVAKEHAEDSPNEKIPFDD